MKYKIIFSPDFEIEIEKTFTYISKNLHSPIAASELMGEINKRISFVKENPFMYPLCPDWLSTAGLRKITVKNYIVVYSVDEDEQIVNFLNIFYGRRNYIEFFQRIDKKC